MALSIGVRNQIGPHPRARRGASIADNVHLIRISSRIRILEAQARASREMNENAKGGTSDSERRLERNVVRFNSISDSK